MMTATTLHTIHHTCCHNLTHSNVKYFIFCVYVCFLVIDVRAASAVLLFQPNCLYCLCIVSVLRK